MRARPFIWILLCLLCLAGAWFFWRQSANPLTKPSALPKVAAPPVAATSSASTAPKILTAVSTNGATSVKTNRFAWRLSNTTRPLGQLMGDRHAILLENALIDSSQPLNFSIPKNLQSPGDPGAYIVQARGQIDAAFRAMLARSGAEIVSYIPNSAYLVHAPAGVANGLTGNPLTQAVVPYEPYYKISSSMPVTVGERTLSSAPAKTNRPAGPSLLDLALSQKPLPAGTYLTLGLFKDGAAATVAQIEKLGGRIVARDNSPFGPVMRVQPPRDWTALATLPGVHIVEPLRQRIHANDLSRATVGVAADTQVISNYMNLSGSNVLVEVNDSGIDANHPDFGTGLNLAQVRVFGDPTLPSLVDTNGHGTHVAGTIAGSGYESTTVTNAQGSIMPGTNWQFRGMAPLANLYSVAAINDTFTFLNVSDQYMQEAPALTNALISNNSWNYGGDNAYDLSAASYDAAVRDALPGVTGSQPVLFVFSAGDDGSGGNADTILSPATAKNVITVGALEQLRGITNIVTDLNSNQTAYWYPETDSSSQVAGYSSLGNVGVETEGANGRFKPDVVAPGSFVVSTRSEQWDEQAYYNPTNYNMNEFSDQAGPGAENFYSLLVPSNVVQVVIELFANISSPTPFPSLPILLWQGTDPRVNLPTLIEPGSISIPPDSTLAPIGAGWSYAVSNNTSETVGYDVFVDIVTTNDNGNYFQVLSNLNNTLDGDPDSTVKPHWYRYESGTSMAAADVSGVLALMQDYFTNQLHSTPSPALLKALLINGARLGVNYSYEIQNPLNYEGWGLIYLPNSLPPGMTNQLNAACASFFVDQSPTNALATGDSHTYMVMIDTNTFAQYLPLRVTLTWTDPPGDPAAAIKLVNSLELVVTNIDTGDVFYGNDIAGGNIYNTPETTNTPNVDTINNVQNVFISYPLGSQYSITVIGNSVNVNAVTAQSNNVVQDYALVIACGEGEVTNAFTVMDNGIVSNPTADQQITYVVNPDAPLINQLAGASTPLLGTNTILLTTNETELNGIQLQGTNIITLGMTNQWHFYVMTNPGPADFTNAAFITFDPETLSIPRMGVFADSTANATRPEADIDLYVSRDPTLMNLNPAAISNADKSVGRGGTEFVYYTDSAPGDVYYVGVYSEDQMAAEYGFIPIFTDIPFSQMNSNGTQVVNGLVLPQNIPGGTPAHPGYVTVFGLAIYPEEIQRVVVTNYIVHQNFGDLIGTLGHGQQSGLSAAVVLNNHDSLGSTFGSPPNPFIYDDSGENNILGSRPSDGPGTLNSYVGQQAIGPWILTEVQNTLGQTGSVTGFNLYIEPHQNLGKGVYGTVGPMGWFYGYIDVPSGTASLTILATNLTQPASLTPPLELYVNVGSIPTLTDTNEYGPAGLTNGTPPGNSIFINSPAPARYWVGLYNGSVLQQNFYLIANLGLVTPPAQVIYSSVGPVPILDDAVTTDSIDVSADQIISSVDVALRVDHPRISDLVFHLISPDGTRVLLVENRGGITANMGATIAVTNVVPVSASGGSGPSSSIINVAMDTGTLSIYYNFYTLPDQMVIYDQGGNLIFNSGLISGSGVFNVAYVNSSYLTIEMNPFGNNGGPGDFWDYTVSALQARQTYLVLTENTNLTTTPIKFAPAPFVPGIPALTASLPEWHSSFEGNPQIEPSAGSYISEGWYIDSGSVDVLPNGFNGSTADEGTNYIDLDGNSAGTISTNVPTVPGQLYVLSFAYAQNPDGSTPPAMQVLQNGNSLLSLTVSETNGWANLGWSTTSVVFTATSSVTTLTFQSLDSPADQFGVLLDCIDLTGILNDDFEYTVAGDYVAGVNPGFGGWTVVSNQVTVISNATLAYNGSTNLLALADGTISRILPTVPGQTYTLSYAYRGPGAVGLWRGESNALDSIEGNNGTLENGTYTNGEVGQAFHLNGSNADVNIPDSPSLKPASVTVDAWVKLDALASPVAAYPGLQYIIFKQNSLSGDFEGYNLEKNRINGQDVFRFEASSGGIQTAAASITVPQVGVWYHLAGTFDDATRSLKIYVNGVLEGTATTTYPLDYGAHPLFIGTTGQGFDGRFDGTVDEATVYNRARSDSEIQAIYQQGSAGKYNTNAPAGIAQGLAEAQVTLNDAPQPIFFGNDTNWQTATYSFIATTTNTPLQITGIEPGMLLDNFVLTTIPTNNYDLYYLPEESLDLLDGEDALGQWQLEIQDDRVGATNPAPSLVSWQLRFNFPFTPPTITTLTNGQALTNNTVPPNGIAYYLIQVPTNADMSTNILFSTTGPLNLLFDAFNPPTGILPHDYLILSSPIPGGSAVLTTNSSPTNFAAGGTYYLGVQNLNSFSVNYGIQVNFHLLPPPLALPQLPELLAIANQLFTVTNAATGGFGPMAYTLTSSVTNGPPIPAIDANGAITWTPATSQAPAVYTLTNIVTDTATLLTATDIFHVLVVLTNGLPAFPGAEGAGGFAIGGRGGDVYHVVNLNDSGPGSLRNGIISTFGSRTIVFDVSGAINLYSPLQINNPYITIAGQTAPGAGITIQGLTTSVENSHDMVVRFLRCRPGDIYAPYFQGDSFHFLGVTNSIADHVSASWSIDTVLSATYSTNITVQWSMIAEPLNHSAYLVNNGTLGYQENGYGSLIRYGSGAVSYHHNLYADNYSYNPRVDDNIQLDFINNVVCNWGAAAGFNEDDATNNPGGYTNYLNYIGNYFIVGNDTTANPDIAFASGVPDPAFTQIYQATNFIDTNAFNIVLDGADTGWGMFSGLLTQLGSPNPMPEIPVTTNSPAFAYEQVLAFAGATVAGVTAAGTPAAGTSLLRDPVDTNIVANVRNKSGQIIDFISSNSFPGVYLSTNFGVTYSGYAGAAAYWSAQGFTSFVGVNPWPVLGSAPQPLDSDGDGIPDYWDITLGMNPAVPHNNHSNPDGYTDLEHYINWLAAPHALTLSNTPVAVDLYALVGLTGNLSFGVTNGTNGIVTLGTDGHTATFTPTNNYFGFASFGFTVTNLATANGFGPVTVSVMVSVTNIATSSLPLTNAVPQTNTVPAGGIVYYLIDVPPNAQFATNILLFASSPVNLLFSQAGFPTGTNTGDYFLLTNSMGGISLLSSNSMPTNIVPGGTYYLGVQNPGGAPVNFAIEVDFYPPPSVPPGGIIYLPVTVPANADFATNILLYATGPLNIWFTTNSPPSITNANDVQLLPDAAYPGGTNGFVVLSAGTTPPLVPGSTYYLGVQNTNSFTVFFALEVNFQLVPAPVTNTITGLTITSTNIGGKFGFLLTWYAPTSDLFRVEWTGSFTPTLWNTFSNIVAYTGPPTPTNGLFTFFDDGSQFPFGPMRFYRVILLQSLTNGVPETSSVSAGGIDYFSVSVPTNADFATNLLFSATGPVNLLFNQTALPTGTNAGDYTLLAGAMNGLSVLSATGAPTNIVPGGTYWLGVQNTNSYTVNFSLEVNFHLIPTNAPASPINISGIAYTNIGGTNGFLFTWYAPTNDLFRVQWTGSLAPPVAWNMFTNLIRYTGPVTPTNGLFSFFDDGSQSGGLGSMRFYRVLQVQSANILTLPAQTNRTVNPLTLLVVTNTATDSDTNAALNYTLAGAPAGGAISANGIITWTPAVAQAGTTNTFTTIVTDNGVPPAQATNSFTVTVGPPPPLISSVTLTTNGLFQLTWFAPTNYQFQVEWATNLVSPVVWNYIPPVAPWLTSGTTNFIFVDTNAPAQMKFYRLIQQYP